VRGVDSCSAGGYYYDSNSYEQAFVVNEGSTGTGVTLNHYDGTDDLGSLGPLEENESTAYVNSISCSRTEIAALLVPSRILKVTEAFVVNGSTGAAWDNAQTIFYSAIPSWAAWGR